MVTTIHYELDGQQVQLEEVADGVERSSLAVRGERTRNIADQCLCPKCGENRHLTILIVASRAKAGSFVKDVCDVEFLELVNSKLPKWDQLEVRNG